jgi:TonB family protein
LGLAFFLLCCAASAKAQWIPKRIVGMDYPELAWKARIQGQVEVVCIINSNGSVVETKVEGNPHPLLAPQARQNASSWTFAGSSDGGKLGGVTLIYTFALRADKCKDPCSRFVFEYPNKVSVTSGLWDYFSINVPTPNKKRRWYWPF